MNKVVSINLNGLIITIDEQAYEQLKKYIDAIQQHFAKTPGGAEITSDIETRIAELLQLKLTSSYNVIQLIDVETVIQIMGNPWQLDDAENDSRNTSHSYQEKAKPAQPKKLKRHTQHKIISGVCSGIGNFLNIDPIIPRAAFLIAFFAFGSGLLLYIILWVIMPQATPEDLPQFTGQITRKLYRNPDNKIVSGVCSGISAYLGIDEFWLRAAFTVSFFIFGSGLLLYIVLWIIMPKAKTASDKLQMRGNNIDVHNIEKQVRHTTTNTKQTASEPNMLLKLIAIVTGIFTLLVIVIPGLIFLALLVFGLNSNSDLTLMFNQLLINNDIMQMSKWGIGAIVLGVVLGFGVFGLRMMFKFKVGYASIASVILFFCGVALTGVCIAKYVSQIKAQSQVVQEYEAFAPKDTFYIDAHNIQNGPIEYSGRVTTQSKNYFTWIYHNNKLMVVRPKVEIKPSADKMATLIINKKSQGNNITDANLLAKQSTCNELLSDSSLVFDNWITIGQQQTPFKYQHINMKLHLPVGTIVKVGENTSRHIYSNNQSRYDECYNRNEPAYYKVTKDGLQCLSHFDDDENLNQTEEFEIDTEVDSTKRKIKIIKHKKRKMGGINAEINEIETVDNK